MKTKEMSITEKLRFELLITYSYYRENVVTAGIWIGEGNDDVLEARGCNKMEASNALYEKFREGNYNLA